MWGINSLTDHILSFLPIEDFDTVKKCTTDLARAVLRDTAARSDHYLTNQVRGYSKHYTVRKTLHHFINQPDVVPIPLLTTPRLIVQYDRQILDSEYFHTIVEIEGGYELRVYNVLTLIVVWSHEITAQAVLRPVTYLRSTQVRFRKPNIVFISRHTLYMYDVIRNRRILNVSLESLEITTQVEVVLTDNILLCGQTFAVKLDWDGNVRTHYNNLIKTYSNYGVTNTHLIDLSNDVRIDLTKFILTPATISYAQYPISPSWIPLIRSIRVWGDYMIINLERDWVSMCYDLRTSKVLWIRPYVIDSFRFANGFAYGADYEFHVVDIPTGSSLFKMPTPEFRIGYIDPTVIIFEYGELSSLGVLRLHQGRPIAGQVEHLINEARILAYGCGYMVCLDKMEVGQNHVIVNVRNFQ